MVQAMRGIQAVRQGRWIHLVKAGLVVLLVLLLMGELRVRVRVMEQLMVSIQLVRFQASNTLLVLCGHLLLDQIFGLASGW